MLKEIVVDGVVMGSVGVPDGWELVAFRAPKIGEHFINYNTWNVCQCKTAYSEGELRWIVRKAFVWPAWVKPGTYCAKDEDGEVYLYEQMPKIKGTTWFVDSGDMMLISPTILSFLDFPVIPGDWKQSLRQKPLEGK